MRSVTFDIVITVTATVGDRELENTADYGQVAVDDLTPSDIAYHMAAEMDYTIDLAKEGEEPLAASYTYEVAEVTNIRELEVNGDDC